MKPKFISPRFRNQTCGASLVTAIVICLSGAAMAQTNNNWTGAVSSAWNNDGNWSAGVVPTKAGNYHAVIDTNSPNIAAITVGIIPPVDIMVGANATGTLNHLSGDAATGATNYMFVGRNTGGNGTYNLANTNATGGTLTGLGQGSGSMTVSSGRLYVGGFAGAATGTCNVHTSGVLAIGNDLAVGSAGGTGVMNVDSGTITTGGWNFIGKNESGTDATGTFNMSGGSFSSTGRTYVGTPTCEGTLNLSGGSFTTNSYLLVGGSTDDNNDYGTSPDGIGHVTVSGSGTTLTVGGEFTLGNRGSTADMTFSAGTINSQSWTQVGRNGGHGTLTMTGGTWNKTGGGDFVVGDFNNSTGTMTMSGGTLTTNNTFRLASSGIGVLNLSNGTINVGDQTWVGQGGGGNGTLNLSANGAIVSQNWVAIGREGGTGLVEMTGGTWTKNASDTNFIIGSSGPGTMNMSDGFVTVADSGPVDRGITWIGENNTGTLNLSGGDFVTERFVLGANGGSTGNLNLNGGSITTGHILGGAGTSNVSFNGTQIYASAGSTDFIQGLGTANIAGGGLLVDDAGFNLTAAQTFTGTGDGGIVKDGFGILTLTGANSYDGPTVVNDGGLVITTASTAGGAITLADFTSLGVNQTTADQATTVASVTLGSGSDTELNFDLGAFAGNTANAPLNVSGALNVNGPVTVNIADSLPVVGTFPLISYTSKTGSGVFTPGTLPDGVDATISETAGLVSLNVSRVNDPYWTGAIDNIWNKDPGGTANWMDDYAEAATTFADGDPALFDDRVGAGPTNVVLNITVAPGDSGVTFANSTVNYTLSGSGKITGTTGLTKSGTGTATISTVNNDYTGVTTLSGGVISVATLTNGGVAGPIGKATSDPSNLVLNGGFLHYTGAGTTIDRGFLTTAIGGIITDNNLTISGFADSDGGNLRKRGAGNLTLTTDGFNFFGANTIQAGINVLEGTLTFDGTGVTQSNHVTGEMWVGMQADTQAHVVLDNTSLTLTSWLGVGRGNGTTNTLNTFTATDSTLNCGNVGFGFSNGIVGYSATQVATIHNTEWINAGQTNIAESGGSDSTVTLSGTSTYVGGNVIRLGLNAGSSGKLIIQDNASLTQTTEYLSIGTLGTGEVTVKNNGVFDVGDADFNVSDVGSSSGTLNIQDNATVSATGVVFVGKNSGTTGTVNMDGGTFNTNTYITIGRWGGSTGVFHMNGGTINQTDPNAGIAVAEHGTGTLNVNGGAINVGGGGFYITTEPTTTGVGVANLNGGTVTAKRVTERDGTSGTSTLNLNGGLLKAGPDANLDFMSNLNTVNVLAGGAHIDSNGQTIAINQNLLDGTGGGGLTKTGAGFLQLNGTNTYTGTTTVSAGSLGGTGSIAGPLNVTGTGTIAPGASAGTFTVVGNTTVAGTYACEIDGATADVLAVTGNLNITGASLNVSQLSAPVGTEFVIATYTGSLTGTFASVTGGTVSYATPGQIKVTVVAGSAYDTWASANGLTAGVNDGPTQDPENDGIENVLEFVLGGDPLASDSSILPDLSVTATNFIFTFNRADESEAEVTLTFQHGSNLTSWTDIAIGADTGSSGAGVVVDEGTPVENPDVITVTIPKGANTKLFGRLHAEK